MMNYSETAPWSANIQNYLTLNKMPPWPPDTNYTRLLHERIITVSEKSAILTWISNGSQMGDTTIANGCPPAPVYTRFQLYGTPNLVLQIPNFPSNATPTADVYNCFSLPTGLTQDRQLRAYEIVTGNGNMVHHVVVTVDTMGTVTSDLSGGCFNQPGDFSIGGWAPGSPPTVYPSSPQLKLGMRIKAGSNLILQMHYPAGTTGMLDSTQIRLYFYPVGTPGIRPVYSNTFLQNWTMFILANTVATYTAKYPTNSSTLPLPLSIYATSPHAHHVNVSMVVYAYRAVPVDTIPLIKIPLWDFMWQGMYVHPNMVKVPAGYKLGSKHVYDNTVNNPDNPNSPPQLVSAGTSTTDEMLFDSFEWTYYQTGDELIDIGSILANDSLLNPAAFVSEISNANISSNAYPNPFSDFVTITYQLKNPSQTSVTVFDLLGNEVKNLSYQYNNAGSSSVLWDGKNEAGIKVPSGVYFYTIRSGNSETTGKIVLMPR